MNSGKREYAYCWHQYELLNRNLAEFRLELLYWEISNVTGLDEQKMQFKETIEFCEARLDQMRLGLAYRRALRNGGHDEAVRQTALDFIEKEPTELWEISHQIFE